ncbi:Transcription factor IIA, alpha/beta subunit [Naviculisporaceae sp. PSN 640]
MSNAAVGTVYEHIISEVINAVRVDFEENGVDDGVLEELKKGWQHKLSQLNVAQFPWDPKPDPPAAPAAAAQQAQAPIQMSAPAATASYTQSTLSPQTSAQPISLPANHLNGNGVTIKNEPGVVKTESGIGIGIKQEPGANATHVPANVPQFNPGAQAGSIAQQRAATALEARYGGRATASIQAIHGATVPQQQQPGQHPLPQQIQPGQQHGMMAQQQMAGQGQQRPQQLTPQQYHQQQSLAAAQLQQQRLQQQQQQQAQQGRPANGLPSAQVDGASSSFEGVLMRRDAQGNPIEMSRFEIDEMLHAQLASRAKQMEGGGLMLPVKEATKHRGIAGPKNPAAQQVDGIDDDIKEEDLDDEDAINSDLDDSDEGQEDDDDDEDSSGHMMLCMYDKVQRVKNKWKCTMKDGVMTVSGREYVFHKGTGEFEW